MCRQEVLHINEVYTVGTVEYANMHAYLCKSCTFNTVCGVYITYAAKGKLFY